MGFGVGASQCLVAPPYVLAAIWMYGCAYFGDKWHIRGPFILVNACIGLVGLGLMGFVKNVGAAYFGVFLITTACNANVPCILTFQANNIRGMWLILHPANCIHANGKAGQWKRALCSATLVGTGGIGGIIGSTVFREQDKETGYKPGMYACMIANALIIIITLALEWKFKRANKRAASGGKVIEGLEGFRYTY